MNHTPSLPPRELIQQQVCTSPDPRRLLRHGSCAFSQLFRAYVEALPQAKVRHDHYYNFCLLIEDFVQILLRIFPLLAVYTQLSVLLKSIATPFVVFNILNWFHHCVFLQLATSPFLRPNVYHCPPSGVPDCLPAPAAAGTAGRRWTFPWHRSEQDGAQDTCSGEADTDQQTRADADQQTR